MKVRTLAVKWVNAVRGARRWRAPARQVAGVVLLGVGVVLMILPGPGIPFVVAGLVLLEWDGVWLHRLGRRLRDKFDASHDPDGIAWAGVSDASRTANGDVG
jgi:drug/metabolite transporter (DMT)-like permease